jgi:hypothetical protein
MSTVALVLLGIAALGGIILGNWLVAGRRPPTGLALMHGLGGAAGVVALAVAVVQGLPSPAPFALVGLVIAAIGGGVLFVGFHLRDKPLPIPLTLAHVLLAGTSLILLLAALLTS